MPLWLPQSALEPLFLNNATMVASRRSAGFSSISQMLSSILCNMLLLKGKLFNSVNEDVRNSSSVSLFSSRLKLFLLAWLHTVRVITYIFSVSVITCIFLLVFAFVRLQFVCRLCSCTPLKKKKFSTVVLSYSVSLYKSLVTCYLSWGDTCL